MILTLRRNNEIVRCFINGLFTKNVTNRIPKNYTIIKKNCIIIIYHFMCKKLLILFISYNI